MGLGGGFFTRQDKELPGSYHKIYSEPNNDIQLTERGIVAVPMVLNWQPDTLIDIQNNRYYDATNKTPQWTRDCEEVFGYPSDAPELVNIREMFRHAKEILIWPLGTATKAANTFGTARNGGVRGNDIAIVVTANVDNTSAFDVLTYVDLKLVDTQTVTAASELIDTAWVMWKKAAVLGETASTPMTGGANATANGASYQAALAEFEALRFNTLICPASDETTIKLYVEWTTRMNEDYGRWHNLVVQDYLADNVLVIPVKNKVVGGAGTELVYYTGGEQAGCRVESVTDNKEYTGEYNIIEATKDQTELLILMKQGYYIYHMVEGKMRVLVDNNSLVTFTKERGKEFSHNQTIRVFHQLATDSDKIFINEFLGIAGTDQEDLALFKMRMVTLREHLQSIKAIKNFRSEDVAVQAGDQYDAYHMHEYIQPNFSVRKLYTETVVGTKQRSE